MPRKARGSEATGTNPTPSASAKPAFAQPDSAPDATATLTVADPPAKPANAGRKRKAAPIKTSLHQSDPAVQAVSASAAPGKRVASKKAKPADGAAASGSLQGGELANGHGSGRPVSALSHEMSLPDGQLGLQGGMAGLSPVKGPAPVRSTGGASSRGAGKRVIIPPAVIELDGELDQPGTSSSHQQRLLSDDSDDSDWQQDWVSGDEDEAMTVDLTQEDEVEVIENNGLMSIRDDASPVNRPPARPSGQGPNMGRSPKPIKPPRARGRASAAPGGVPQGGAQLPGGPGRGRGRGQGRASVRAEGDEASAEAAAVPKRVRRKKEEVIKEAVDDPWDNYGANETAEDDIDELSPNKVAERMEPPPELLMDLLPFQKEFLAWAVAHERSEIRGGILADEMGMGKTIQAISLIMTHRTDDMSQLPSGLPTSSLTQQKSLEAAPRPKIRMVGAPPPPSNPLHPPPNPTAPPAPPLDPDVDAAGADEEAVQQLPTQQQQPAGSGKPSGGGSFSTPPSSPTKPSEGPHKHIPVSPPMAPHVKEARAVPTSSAKPSAEAAGSCAGDFCRATLVVCPLVAVIQWRQEIARFTAPNSVQVVVYHGSKRAAEIERLTKADVVLTTYSTLENEWRKHATPCKVTCSYCRKQFYPERLRVHLKFFCGPNARKSSALAKQQKKRPKGDKTSAKTLNKSADTANDDSASSSGDDSSSSGDDSSSDEDDAPPAKKRIVARGQNGTKAAASAKQRGGKAAAKVTKGAAKKKPAAKGKASGKTPIGKAADDSDWSADSSEGESSSSEDDSSDADSAEDSAGDDSAPAAPKRAPPRDRASIREWEARAFAEAESMIGQAQQQWAKSAGNVPDSILHKIKWRRLVLDEAHCIKDRRSSTAKAVFALTSKYKWALSGTPLQNRVGELYSLVRYLRIFPFAYYFCHKAPKPGEARCNCHCLDYPFKACSRECLHCGHAPMSHHCWWNKYVANPIKKFGYVGKGRQAMLLLKREILTRTLLRRTKVQCADVLALPPRTIVLRRDRFDEREKDFYDALYTQSQAQFDAYVSSGTVVNNYAHIFDLLIRLRQAVDHPYLVVYSATAPGAKAAAQLPAQALAAVTDAPGAEAAGEAAGAASRIGPTSPADSAVEVQCRICGDPPEDARAAACGCSFCRACVSDYVEGAPAAAACPGCSQALSIDLSAASATPASVAKAIGRKRNSILTRLGGGDFQSSTKIEALREEVHNMLQNDPSAKAIVFSQFTSMLDLIAFRLQQVGVKCVRLEGSMSMEARDRMIEAFTHDPSVKVFLMSLKAGGVALNLTAASHVMLMDPWWNPAVEQQAQDRIHRLGQFKPIHVTRFVIGGTIEERILKLQEKKQLVFEGTVGRDAEALGRLTEDDLRFLFG